MLDWQRICAGWGTRLQPSSQLASRLVFYLPPPPPSSSLVVFTYLCTVPPSQSAQMGGCEGTEAHKLSCQRILAETLNCGTCRRYDGKCDNASDFPDQSFKALVQNARSADAECITVSLRVFIWPALCQLTSVNFFSGIFIK